MKNNFQKTIIPLLVTILFLEIYLFYYFYNKVHVNDIITTEMNVKIQNKLNNLNELRSLEQGLKVVEKEKIELDTHFIQSSNLVPFLDSIEELAPTVGADAKTISVDISPDQLSLLVGLKANGSFSSLYKFITLLENSNYELELTSFNLSKENNQDSSKTTGWTAQIDLKLISFIN